MEPGAARDLALPQEAMQRESAPSCLIQIDAWWQLLAALLQLLQGRLKPC